jgi:hypothetical protein
VRLSIAQKKQDSCRAETSSPKRELSSSSPLMASKVSEAQAQAHPKKVSFAQAHESSSSFSSFFKNRIILQKPCIFAS